MDKILTKINNPTIQHISSNLVGFLIITSPIFLGLTMLPVFSHVLNFLVLWSSGEIPYSLNYIMSGLFCLGVYFSLIMFVIENGLKIKDRIDYRYYRRSGSLIGSLIHKVESSDLVIHEEVIGESKGFLIFSENISLKYLPATFSLTILIDNRDVTSALTSTEVWYLTRVAKELVNKPNPEEMEKIVEKLDQISSKSVLQKELINYSQKSIE